MSGTITPAKTIREYTESTSPATSAAILIQPTSGAYLWTSITNLLSGLVSKTVAATISAVHTFNPGSATAPFILHSNAQGQLVTGLNADQLDGKDSTDIRRVRYASIAASSAISNTTSETAFSKSYTIPAARLVAGSVITVRAGGTYSTTGAPTIAFAVRVGGLSGGAIFARTPTCENNASTRGWSLTASAVVRSSGGSGSVAPGPGAVSLNNASLSDSNNLMTAITVDTTATKDLVLTVTWSAASSSNTITMTTFVVEIEDAVSTS